ncbi:MAG TPA: pyrroline-5-carboxylate reductase [Candidatus Omnitrophica bacterium]|nr:pyrroline-5-carboxylate reductase [Candidatus Omnitrophota bacterium]
MSIVKKIGIIGFGFMGSAIAEQIKLKHEVWVFDKDKDKIKGLTKINIAGDIIDLGNEADVIILAVKPQDFTDILKELKEAGNYIKNKIIISIAAGITTTYISKCFGEEIRVVRVMPNLPARIAMGMSCLCKGEFAKEEDLKFAQELFDNLGDTLVLNEDKMDAATAISGSGPGYYYDLIEGKEIKEAKEYLISDFIPSLRAAAESLDFTKEEAKKLADSTGYGSFSFLEQSNITPLELRKQVTSKGGTTEAGLEVLHRGGSLEDAAKVALKRAKELSK